MLASARGEREEVGLSPLEIAGARQDDAERRFLNPPRDAVQHRTLIETARSPELGHRRSGDVNGVPERLVLVGFPEPPGLRHRFVARTQFHFPVDSPEEAARPPKTPPSTNSEGPRPPPSPQGTARPIRSRRHSKLGRMGSPQMGRDLEWKSRVGVTPLPRVRIPLSPPAP